MSDLSVLVFGNAGYDDARVDGKRVMPVKAAVGLLTGAEWLRMFATPFSLN